MSVVWLDRYALARAATQFAPLILSGPAPDSGVLTGLQRPVEAVSLHCTRATDRLRGLDLGESRTSGTDGEEDLGIDVSTGRSVAPVHRCHPHSSPSAPVMKIVKRFSNRTGTNIRRAFPPCKYFLGKK
jgi:hypothetical protein